MNCIGHSQFGFSPSRRKWLAATFWERGQALLGFGFALSYSDLAWLRVLGCPRQSNSREDSAPQRVAAKKLDAVNSVLKLPSSDF